jgi:hypothetical protein
MEHRNQTAFGPEQLGSICHDFDQARARLRRAGQILGSGAAEELAAVMLQMAARGLSGDELVEAAVRVARLKSGYHGRDSDLRSAKG